MHRLLKRAVAFQKLAEEMEEKPIVDETLEDKIGNYIISDRMYLLLAEVKTYYDKIKSNPELLDDIANYFSIRLSSLLTYPNKIFDQQQKELCNLIFKKAVGYWITSAHLLNILKYWASFISPELIRDYTRKLLEELKLMSPRDDDEAKGDEYYKILSILSSLVRNVNIRPYINAPLLEKVLSYHNPSRLPSFKPEKEKLNATDIIAMLKGRRVST